MEEVLKALVCASERAANVARSCCSGPAKECLVIAEKCGGEANTRFDRDFKTIADVLAQESARYEIALRCPDLATQLRGEECSEISGVSIKLCESREQTTELLSALMPLEAAKKMSDAAHVEVNVEFNWSIDIQSDLKPGDLGVWIDPIDATAEFITGVKGEADAGHGLPCVTVLIGAYLRCTGEPVVGVINQPFYNGGQGRITWGVCYNDIRAWSGVNVFTPENKSILMSGAESPEIWENFKTSGWEVKSVPGAGHKLLKVALGESAAYIVSKGTTFRWDTCGPHAILRAQGGDLLSYKTYKPITYNDPANADTQQYANSNGIIAYTSEIVLIEVKNIIASDF